MAVPIEMVKGDKRQTVYSAEKLALAEADGWQRVSTLSPQQQAELARRAMAPWVGYDELTAQEVLAQANGLPPDRIAAIVAYESAGKGRVSIINKLTNAERPAPIPAASTEQQLEAETGHDFIQSGTNPPTFVETDAPAPQAE